MDVKKVTKKEKPTETTKPEPKEPKAAPTKEKPEPKPPKEKKPEAPSYIGKATMAEEPGMTKGEALIKKIVVGAFPGTEVLVRGGASERYLTVKVPGNVKLVLKGRKDGSVIVEKEYKTVWKGQPEDLAEGIKPNLTLLRAGTPKAEKKEPKPKAEKAAKKADAPKESKEEKPSSVGYGAMSAKDIAKLAAEKKAEKKATAKTDAPKEFKSVKEAQEYAKAKAAEAKAKK